MSELRNDLRIDSAQPLLRWIVRAFRDDIENTVARVNEGPLTDAAVKEHVELLEPRDERDNGGKFHLEPDEPYVPYPEGLDFGIMLWDVAKRRAPPRPPLPLPKPQVDEGLP